MAARVPDMFHNFWLVKNHKITNNSATIVAITDWESSEFQKCFDVAVTKFKNNQILSN
jgi:hypothetical protein